MKKLILIVVMLVALMPAICNASSDELIGTMVFASGQFGTATYMEGPYGKNHLSLTIRKNDDLYKLGLSYKTAELLIHDEYKKDYKNYVNLMHCAAKTC